MKTVLEKDGKIYVITFDKYGDLDTVEQRLVSTNRVVKQIINHADEIRQGKIPQGFKKHVG